MEGTEGKEREGKILIGIFQHWEMNLVRVKYSITGPAQEILYNYTFLCVYVSVHVCA